MNQGSPVLSLLKGDSKQAEKKNFTNEMIMDAVEQNNETAGRPLSPTDKDTTTNL
jgi:hypothetical protein